MIGCLLGGALGDALGACSEGSSSGRAFAIPPELRITDDTQLTLATCESIIEAQAVDPEAVAKHFLRWYRERRITGIGSSTLKALTELDAGGHCALVGASGERSAGNGAAMRAAPLAFFLDPDVEADRRTIRDVCRITHRNDEAYIGALAVVRSVRHVIAGDRTRSTLVTSLVGSLPDSRVRDRLTEIRDRSLTIEEYASRYSASGYVADSVPLAILATVQSSDVLNTTAQLVQCGGDTDTIASMFGQICGAAYGPEALPMEIVGRIDAAPHIRETASELSRV